MTIGPPPEYHHTQKGPWWLLLLAIGAMLVTVAWLIRDEPVAPLLMAAVGAVLLTFSLSFRHLTVAGEGDHLAVRFGPMPLFQKRIRYEAVESVEVGKTSLLDGWGIHLSLKGGWVWNIWGWDCVVIRHGGATTRVGTDDAENLAAFLRAKAPGR